MIILPLGHTLLQEKLGEFNIFYQSSPNKIRVLLAKKDGMDNE
jgi:hypothetical protein